MTDTRCGTQLKTVKLEGSITSLELMEGAAQRGARRVLLAGTRDCEIYAVDFATFAVTLVVTCHRCAINDVAFPRSPTLFYCLLPTPYTTLLT